MKFKKVACYRYPILKLIFSLLCRVSLRKHYIIKATWSVKNRVQKFVVDYKKKYSKNKVEKLAIWQHFLISGKHRHTLF